MTKWGILQSSPIMINAFRMASLKVPALRSIRTSKRSRGCWRSKAAQIFPAYSSFSESVRHSTESSNTLRALGDRLLRSGGKERSAHDQIRLNLDRRVLPLNRTAAPKIGPLDLLGNNLRPRNPALDIPGDPDQGVADLANRQIALADGKIDKVDIDGNARKIPEEEIDGRPALQGKDGLPIDQGQDAGTIQKREGETCR